MDERITASAPRGWYLKAELDSRLDTCGSLMLATLLDLHAKDIFSDLTYNEASFIFENDKKMHYKISYEEFEKKRKRWCKE